MGILKKVGATFFVAVFLACASAYPAEKKREDRDSGREIGVVELSTDPIPVQQPDGSVADVAFDITAVTATNEAQAREALKLFREKLKDAVAKDPDIRTEIVAIEHERDQQYLSSHAFQNPANVRAELSLLNFKVPDLHIQKVPRKLDQEVEKNLRETLGEKLYRYSFALIRGTLNGRGAIWSLMYTGGMAAVSQVSFYEALPTGIAMGMMSAGLQIKLDPYQRYLRKGPKSVPESHPHYERIREAYSYGKWYLTEIIFLGTAKMMQTFSGINRDPSFFHSIGSVTRSAAFAFVAQALFDIGIAAETQLSLKRNPKRARLTRFLNQVSNLVVSLASVTGAVAELRGLPIGKPILIGMGVAGALNYVRVRRKVHRAEAADLAETFRIQRIRFSKKNCSVVLSQP